VTWTDNLSLSAADLNVVNYNAREIRVLNNPGTAGDSARISGTISGRQTNDLLKTGPGDLELTASNTYLGATIVQEGRLFVNGNSQSSFLHKVMSGATLAGKWTIGNVMVDAAGRIAPGQFDAIASILTAKDIQFTATSKLVMELGGATAGGDSTTGYDQLRAIDPAAGGNATVKLNGATLEATFLNGYLAGLSDVFFLIINDGTDAIEGQFAQGNSITIGSQNFSISYTANSDTGLLSGGNDVALQLVPEPSSALLLVLGAGLLSRRRRQSA
jgi:autotransporter-associated beta strand protein